ncbi:hypothetical protein ASL83_003385 [Vibrio parahaemolyticus]|nr:hypothetical protein [Vibrio parahaemolyticus]
MNFELIALGLIAYFVLLVLRVTTNVCDRLLVARGHGYLVISLGSIGTPVHELGHAVAAIFFGHKILKIELFNPKPNGQLGVVEHSYKTTSFYQNLGCFFIGIAPIFSGLLACWFLTVGLWPEFHIDDLVSSLSIVIDDNGLQDAIGWFYSTTYASHIELWSLDWKRYLLWAVCVTSVVKHMLPSVPDMQGVKRGIVHFAIFVCGIYLILPSEASAFIESNLLFLLSLQVVFVAYVLLSQLLILLLSNLLFKWKIRNVQKCKTRS